MRRLHFEVDKLTNSIENTLTGELCETEILRLHPEDARFLDRSEWEFNWSSELKDTDREVFALVTKENHSIFHGMMSIEDLGDHIFLHLIESASFNKGSKKLYVGVAPNLVAFACKESFDKGYGGALAFVAKTALVRHYEASLGAKRLYGNRMFIDTAAAYPLVRSYFKDFDNA
ncbi:MAG TPA: hypothetical protein VFD13_01655 [Candidatus Kapabacteria bacterium]|nr:hypothetical protein [Candidatus Kapabacteria bacterium]